jgi:hypothetical protein
MLSGLTAYRGEAREAKPTRQANRRQRISETFRCGTSVPAEAGESAGGTARGRGRGLSVVAMLFFTLDVQRVSSIIVVGSMRTGLESWRAPVQPRLDVGDPCRAERI